jgi:ketosteroid isomerase-like protein
MSQETLELFRRAVEAFNQRDVDRLDELTTRDFEFSPYLATLIETTIYRGLEGLHKYFEDSASAWERIVVRLDDVREVRSGVIYSSGELHGKGRASGMEVRVPVTWISEIREGKLASVRSYGGEADALEAAGLSE